MIETIISGKLHTAAETRTSKTGKPFTVCKLTAPAGAGPALFVNLCAFDKLTADALLRCRPGDALAVAGTLTPGAWIDKDGNARPNLSIVVAQVMTLHALARRRAEAAPAAAPRHHTEDFGPQDWPA
jgi:single-stranded DNA-binding protein